ncbi:MAG: hypothetical protein IKI95_05930 [Clostridia bacterium]|nr:hypothetical protein [Clostridia bacterium]
MEENKELISSDNKVVNFKIDGEQSTQTIHTTINDPKMIFNLDNKCDYKLNDCKGQMIRVKDVLIKIIETKKDEESEFKKITILIDDQNKSYVTASKMFTNELLRYINMFGIESIRNGLEIKIIERSVKDSSNKALGFELV